MTEINLLDGRIKGLKTSNTPRTCRSCGKPIPGGSLCKRIDGQYYHPIDPNTHGKIYKCCIIWPGRKVYQKELA